IILRVIKTANDQNSEQKEKVENENKEEKKEKSEKKKKTKTKPKKFVFNCTNCGQCCSRDFPIYYEDLKRWNMDQTLQRVYPHLQIKVNPPAGFQITFKKVKGEDGKEVCPFYNANSNERCDIFFSKPINCLAFPLGFDKSTKRYYLVDKSCDGLGKGEMTKESLREMRKNARLDYNCRIRTLNTLPLLQMIFLQFFNQQSQQVMDSLSEEDRKELERILEKKESAATATEGKKEEE
ncbi:MAG: hypothetical protein GF329_17705, partial [Candidatus Lokiarchaeota archaeon]|nr:hypothetical protein [Candidatus Lokiarchaeota archaeon]